MVLEIVKKVMNVIWEPTCDVVMNFARNVKPFNQRKKNERVRYTNAISGIANLPNVRNLTTLLSVSLILSCAWALACIGQIGLGAVGAESEVKFAYLSLVGNQITDLSNFIVFALVLLTGLWGGVLVQYNKEDKDKKRYKTIWLANREFSKILK